ncbi:6,7-dimethyl-8-ribityllumazine synthase [Thermococcus sp. P6]|uniref:6,7-dimethyl-8-ribityllumazine synthase n=1 Tax=Thermococcus sp. P6 TaxID=122420 RepID=UPI000B59C755|nr:6,7-dimethyl-8-ribityllumazine synthase [Thermococcus sp. P6]ASJ10348.1 6,7-dimethyl-8-ribityllumazine synthase [Thermococcus sp. P6]
MIYEGGYSGKGLKIGIVVSRFNDLLTEELLKGALDCFRRHEVEELEVFRVPGAFEIPFVVKELAKKGKYDAILTLGAVVKGETYHFDLVASEVAKGIAQVNLNYETPVVFGVITVEDELQGLNRAGVKSNRGFEYAMATLEMANLRKN